MKEYMSHSSGMSGKGDIDTDLAAFQRNQVDAVGLQSYCSWLEVLELI